MSSPSARPWLLALALVGRLALAADPRVLTTSGIKVQGLGIAGLEGPAGAPDGAIVFRGVNTTLELAGHSFAPGDPLPAPLRGTFEEILQGATAGSFAAVVAAANGPDAASVIVLVGGGSPSAVVATAPADETSLRGLTMNSRGDVAYRLGPPGEIRTRASATGGSTSIAGPDRLLSSLRGFAIDENGGVAWMDRRGEVSHWDAVHGTRMVGRGLRATGTQRRAVALHATFGLAFATRDSLTRWNPNTAASSVVVRRGRLVEGAKVLRLYGDVGFRDDGTLTVRARLRKASSKYVCVTGDVPSRCDAPGASGAGTTVAPKRTAAVFRMAGSTIVPVVRPGDALPGAGPLADVGAHAIDGGAIAFTGVLEDGRDVLGRWRDGGLQTLAVDGERAGARSLDLAGALYDAGRSLAVADASLVDAAGDADGKTVLVVADARGRLRPIKAPRGRLFRDFAVEDAALVNRRLVVLDGDRELLFTAHGRRLKPFLAAMVRRRSLLGSVSALTSSGSRLVLVATDTTHGLGLYELRARRASRLVDLPESPTLLAAGEDDVVLTVSASDDGGATFRDHVWVVRGGTVHRRLRVGDATPAGIVTSIEGLGIAGPDVVLSVGVAGDVARHALIAVGR